MKRSKARVSCNIAVVVSMNVAKMAQWRQDGRIVDCKVIMDHVMSQHRREYGVSHDGAAPMIIALQEISSWKAVQLTRQTSFIFIRDPSGISDCGFCLQRSLSQYICQFSFGSRWAIVAVGQLLVISLHVMVESRFTILDEVSNTINFIKNKFEDRQFMVAIGMCANLTLPRGRNGESGPITCGWIMDPKSSHKRKDVKLLMAFLDGHGVRLESSMSPLRPGVSCHDTMDHSWLHT